MKFDSIWNLCFDSYLLASFENVLDYANLYLVLDFSGMCLCRWLAVTEAWIFLWDWNDQTERKKENEKRREERLVSARLLRFFRQISQQYFLFRFRSRVLILKKSTRVLEFRTSFVEFQIVQNFVCLIIEYLLNCVSVCYVDYLSCK